MEATGEVKGILGKIIPPRLEDAGLEDCALPPDAIKEAFAKAAKAVRSIIPASSYEDEAEGHCVKEPWPVLGDSSDTLVGIADGVGDVAGGCANEKGAWLREEAGDEVAVRDEDQKVDEVVVTGPNVPEGGKEKACVEGLQGLLIEEKKSKGKLGKKPSNDVDDDSEEKESDSPILTEAYV